MSNHTSQQIIKHFQNSPSFTREELYDYFLSIDDSLKASTFAWRIFDLKKKNIIGELQRGVYTLNIKPIYEPAVDKTIQKLSALFLMKYKNADYCIWNTEWLNEFTTHQFSSKVIVFETEKDLKENTAHFLIENGITSIVWSLYGHITSLIGTGSTVIMQNLISRAPTLTIEYQKNTVIVPSLEKILVDVFSNEHLFRFVRNEMENIFQKAIERYSINFTTLLGYARRRGKYEDLHTYLNTHFPESVKNLHG